MRQTNYKDAFKKLVNSIGVVFNQRALESSISASSLNEALDKTHIINLPMFCKPFHRPFQYIGMIIDNAAKEVDREPNEVGNIIVDSDDCEMVLWAEGNFG
ncbi:hypothetical protein [Myxosarcina sp. GI1(2024)]